MKTNAALEREIKAMARVINNEDRSDPCHIGARGTTKYVAAFAAYRALLWARGRREEYPSVAIAKMEKAG